MKLSNFTIEDENAYKKFKSLLSLKGLTIGGVLNDFIKTYSSQPKTTIDSWIEKKKLQSIDFYNCTAEDLRELFKDKKEFKRYSDRLNWHLRMEKEKKMNEYRNVL